MRSRPIIFSARQVRALLEGRKTQTRRAVLERWLGCLDPEDSEADRAQALSLCPYGVAGDRLWVRESFALLWPNGSDEPPPEDWRQMQVEYRADKPRARYPGGWPADAGGDPDCVRWRPSLHMPRWASRLELEVTAVRIERLQAISEADAVAEGVRASDAAVVFEGGAGLRADLSNTSRGAFAVLWDSVNSRSEAARWRDNPLVWVIAFRPVPGARIVKPEAR